MRTTKKRNNKSVEDVVALVSLLYFSSDTFYVNEVFLLMHSCNITLKEQEAIAVF